jgi:transposase-like protein
MAGVYQVEGGEITRARLDYAAARQLGLESAAARSWWRRSSQRGGYAPRSHLTLSRRRDPQWRWAVPGPKP